MVPDLEISNSTGIVAIGRNEGERLIRCLDSLAGTAPYIAYVDSGSVDDSVAVSRARGLIVVELDLRIPFTAARARNSGLEALLTANPGLDRVFFVDGDCEVESGWLEKAHYFLDRRPDVAAVSGRRRERYPEKSIYNLLQNMEWADYPAGDAVFCGGDALMRVAALRAVGGYRKDLICGEEPELCVRLRQAGWKIWLLDEPMTLHDAAIYSFGQWWRRSVRTGYGFAQGAALHGSSPQRHFVTESRRAWGWGLWLPVMIGVAVLSLGWWALLLLLVYPVQVFRITLHGRRSFGDNLLKASSMTLGKFPEMLGQMRFVLDQWRHSQTKLIEYKHK